MNNFNRHMKTGDYGERVVVDIFDSMGLSVQKAITQGSHPYDMTVIPKGGDEFKAECKCKARLNDYLYTGIDVRHYHRYLEVANKTGQKFFLYFIDYHPAECRVYHQELTVLSKYADFNMQEKSKIVTFPLEVMIDDKHLTEDQFYDLIQLSKSTRNHPYKMLDGSIWMENDPEVYAFKNFSSEWKEKHLGEGLPWLMQRTA